MASQSVSPAKTEQDVPRNLSNFPPTVWGCSFASIPPQDSEFESYTKEVDLLKEKVKDMLMQSTKNLSENIDLINSLCRLGVFYHFESEINEQLRHIFVSLPKLLEENDYDLYTLALLFRVLRQHGYKMPCDVFNKFKDNDGEFKKSLTNDVKGLLSLYEATFLNVHGEDILDEALAFTRQHLKTLAEKSSPHLAKHIRKSLYRPFHYGPQRIETLLYISFYEGEESRDETLLKFAKLDFNRLQLLHRKELALVSRWWKDTKIVENLTYTRDRIVEVYVWALESIVDPQFSRARVQYTKHTMMVTAIDDTYDAYGTFDELKHFTAALERFSVDAIDELPEYMKFLYKVLLKLFEDTKKDWPEECSYKTSYAIETCKEIARSYFIEAEWNNEGFVPTFEEYMQNGLVTSAIDINAAAFIVGADELGMREIVWLRDNPKIVKTAKFVSRLFNDIAIREEEQKKGAYSQGMLCYMNDHGISQQQKAREEIFKNFGERWKDLNEEWMKPTIIPKILLKFLISYVRISDFTYRGGIDTYTHGLGMKEYVTALFVDPMPM